MHMLRLRQKSFERQKDESNSLAALLQLRLSLHPPFICCMFAPCFLLTALSLTFRNFCLKNRARFLRGAVVVDSRAFAAGALWVLISGVVVIRPAAAAAAQQAKTYLAINNNIYIVKDIRT